MSKNRFDQPLWLAIASGIAVFLAFEKFCILPAIFFFPALFNRLSFATSNFKTSFLWGFLTSFVIMLGGFYWVVYVLHEFGYLPWAVAALLYLGFCGFGALNFPLFCGIANFLQRKLFSKPSSSLETGFWFALALPALFTLIEWAIPKLFPWYIGHSFYKQLWAIQIAEITGTTFLTFSVYSLGSVLGVLFFPPRNARKPSAAFLAVPAACVAICVGFSFYRLKISPPDSSGNLFSVALVQANIGSLEKVAAEKGMADRVRYVVDRYKSLSLEAIAKRPVDLVVWPETAMPFQLESQRTWATEIREFIKSTNTPFLMGGYLKSEKSAVDDSNAAFLFEPETDRLRMETYRKIILLAFGEYLPFGDWFPSLYLRFPQIANFERGTSQAPFVLKNGTRLGTTICYEAIVPSFYRQTVKHGVHAIINLTNDSWFGPTSEPFLHASLTPFRAIESRVPLFRATNTGISFTVDVTGKMSSPTPVYEPEVLHATLPLPKEPPFTFYIRYGDWFIGICVLLLGLGISLFLRKDNAPIPV